jgi:hypothetical protein
MPVRVAAGALGGGPAGGAANADGGANGGGDDGLAARGGDALAARGAPGGGAIGAELGGALGGELGGAPGGGLATGPLAVPGAGPVGTGPLGGTDELPGRGAAAPAGWPPKGFGSGACRRSPELLPPPEDCMPACYPAFPARGAGTAIRPWPALTSGAG